LTNIEHVLRLRPGTINDAPEVGKIIFDAFSQIADKHGFPREFPTVDIGINVACSFLSLVLLLRDIFYSTAGRLHKKMLNLEHEMSLTCIDCTSKCRCISILSFFLSLLLF